MSWRLAKSLDQLRAQINALAPGRSKTSDGTIGDAAHSARKSDHNPNEAGVVCALDITHDPNGGMDCQSLANALQAGRDGRIKYVIWKGQIMSGSHSRRAWQWREYTGSNPHNKHLHISVAWPLGDSSQPWAISTTPAQGLELVVNGARVPGARITDGVAMAPVRGLAVALGAEVDYDAQANRVTVTR